MKMKHYESFSLYLAAQVPKNQTVIRALRRFVKKTAPRLSESVKWGNGVWLLDGSPVLYVYSAPDHVQFGFFGGSRLKDPLGLLLGKGAYVRHIKIRRASGIDPKAFAALVKQAAPAQRR